MLEVWEMRGTLSLPSLPGPFWPEVIASDRVLFMDQMEQFDYLTVCKQITG